MHCFGTTNFDIHTLYIQNISVTWVRTPVTHTPLPSSYSTNLPEGFTPVTAPMRHSVITTTITITFSMLTILTPTTFTLDDPCNDHPAISRLFLFILFISCVVYLSIFLFFILILFYNICFWAISMPSIHTQHPPLLDILMKRAVSSLIPSSSSFLNKKQMFTTSSIRF